MTDMWTSVTVSSATPIDEDLVAETWDKHAEDRPWDGTFDLYERVAKVGGPTISYDFEISGHSKYEISGARDAAEALSAAFPDADVEITEEWTGEGGPSSETTHYHGGQKVELIALEPVTRNTDGTLPTPLGHDVDVDDHADSGGAWVRVEIPSDPDKHGRSHTLAIAEITPTEARALSASLLKAANGAEFHYARIEKEQADA